MKRIALSLTTGTVLALVLAACGGGVVDAGSLEASDPDTETDSDNGTDASPEDERSDDGTGHQTDGAPESTNDADSGSTTDTSDTTAIRLYYVTRRRQVRASRPLPGLRAT